jgi:hypothetical protein
MNPFIEKGIAIIVKTKMKKNIAGIGIELRKFFITFKI